jgi:hypothetical protein
LLALQLYVSHALHPAYYKDEGMATRTSWHHYLVAAHSNPKRTKLYGIPQHMLACDDAISYLLFERELARRGENLEDYLHPDAGTWQLRTTHRRYDYLWGKYDRVVRDIFLRLVQENPGYVFRSICQYEPAALVHELFAADFWKWKYLLDYRLCALLIIGAVAARRDLSAARGTVVLLFGTFLLLLSFLPALVSGVMPIRLVESFFILVTLGYFFAGWVLARVASLAAGTSLPSKGRSVYAAIRHWVICLPIDS